MSLRNLRTLVAIARHGSFAAAAQALHLTQSAVSLQIKALEEQYGVSLFDRSGRSPRLNERGQTLVDRAEQLLEDYESLGSALDIGEELAGPLHIGALHTAQVGPLPRALVNLQRQHPKIQISLSSGPSIELGVLVEQRQVDAALITEPLTPPQSGLQFQPYDTEPFYVIAPKSIAAAADHELLQQHPFIRFNRHATAGQMIDQLLRTRSIFVHETMQLDSLDSAKRMVAEGLGVAVIPLTERHRRELADDFTLVPFGKPQLNRRVGMLRFSNHPRGRLADALLHELREQIARADID